MTLAPVRNPADIDLRRHGVIEASAGTGKTYTIENLVVRLLVEEEVTIDRILLVTFTEKATGEMGSRIRRNLEKALREWNGGAEGAGRLQAALDRFDEASIQTIHGFCQRMLRLYALENGIPFATEVVEDPPLFASCLRQLMRKVWPRKYGAAYGDLLRQTGFAGSVSARQGWESKVASVANRWNAILGDRLEPKAPEDLAEFIAESAAKFDEIVGEIGALVGSVDPNRLEMNEFHQAYARLNFNSGSRKKILEKIVAPILRFIGKSQTQGAGWCDFREVMETAGTYKPFKESGGSFETLIPEKWKGGKNNLAEVCPRLPRVVELLESLRRSNPEKRFLAGLIQEVREEVDRTKADRGAIAFSDMILRLYSALQPENPGAERFLAELRQRFQYALVDEFQDTDAAQWGIFRRIFLESKSGARLFVIGDPKQSIYRFRGADVQTYLAAKKAILEHPEGSGYSLAVNWRSTVEMIGEFNRLFSNDSGWFRAGSGIEHQGVQAPTDETMRSTLLEDPTGCGAVTLVRFGEEMGLRRIRFGFYRWIAAEIVRLLENRESFRMRIKEKERSLEPNDICVLVRTKNEARDFQEILGDRVPNTYYKKPGLYDSTEALHLATLLRALAFPDVRRIRAALLTDFFRIPPDRLGGDGDLEGAIPDRELFDRWIDWAERRDWPSLFHSLLADSRLSFFRDSEGALHPVSERSWTNYQHLVQNLQTEPDLHRWDAVDLVEALDRYRNRLVEISSEGELHRLESETPKVQIMTLHMSKGLEFPIVFVAGGVTEKPPTDSWLCVHDPETRGLVYDLAKKQENADLAKAEARDESSRLFYVALTRAQHKLYLPFLEKGGGSSPGPLAADLRKSIESTFGAGGSPEATVVPFEDPSEIGAPVLSLDPKTREEIRIPEPLFPPERLDYSDRRTRSHSFTSLAHRHPGRGRGFAAGEEPRREPDERETAFEALEIVDREQGLPKGERTGTMMHALFEDIDWREVAEAPSPESLFDPESTVFREAKAAIELHRIATLAKSRSLEDLAREAVRLVWNSLQVPLPLGGGLRLASLRPEDRLHEMEFHLPLSEAGAPTTELRGVEGFLNGFVDLAFRHEGKYYLLDWKTNWLPDYSPHAIAESMEQNQYTLQYSIYRVALDRLLGQSLGIDSAGSCFGGVLYLYLRGIDPARPDQGVYWKSASELEQASKMEKDLSDRVFGAEGEEEYPR